jgi:hypothetical protein
MKFVTARSPFRANGPPNKPPEARPPFTAKQEAAILDLYLRLKMPGNVIAVRLRVSVNRVYQFLHHRGVTRRSGHIFRLSPEQWQQLKDSLLTTPDATLGRQFGYTKERVRQIRKELGIPSSRLMRQERAGRARLESQTQRQLVREQRRAATLAYLSRLSKRWKSGLTLRAIAEEDGVSLASIIGRVCEGRKLDPDKFPFRRPPRLPRAPVQPQRRQSKR